MHPWRMKAAAAGMEGMAAIAAAAAVHRPGLKTYRYPLALRSMPVLSPLQWPHAAGAARSASTAKSNAERGRALRPRPRVQLGAMKPVLQRLQRRRP